MMQATDIDRAQKHTMGGQKIYEKISWALMFLVFLEMMVGFYACSYVRTDECVKEEITADAAKATASAGPTRQLITENAMEKENTYKLQRQTSNTASIEPNEPSFDDNMIMEENQWDPAPPLDAGKFIFTYEMETFAVEWITIQIEECVNEFNVTVSKSITDQPEAFAFIVPKDQDFVSSEFRGFDQKSMLDSVMFASSI